MSKQAQNQIHDHNHDDHDHAGHDHSGHTHAHGDEPQSHPYVAQNTKIMVTVPWKTVKVAYDAVLQKLAQTVKADGFRKGKVPPAIVEKMVEQNKLFEEVLDRVLPQAYSDALKAEKKLPISRPEIEPIHMEKDKDWEFAIYFAEKPEITLGKFQDAVKKGFKEAKEEIKKVNEERAKVAKKDDKADEKNDKTPTAATEPLTEPQQEDVKIRHIFQNLVETVKPKVPELLIRTQVDQDLQRLSDQLRQLNLSAEDYLKSRQMKVEDLRGEYATQALMTLQIEFILAEIARDQKITVDEKELNETLDKVADGKLPLEQRNDPDYRSYVFSTLLKQKVLKYLLSLE